MTKPVRLLGRLLLLLLFEMTQAQRKATDMECKINNGEERRRIFSIRSSGA